jgi:ABC-type uncharacterized transport system substrate-binding protein
VISRRRLLIAIGCALALATRDGGAQAVPRIGILGDTPWEPLKEGLRDLGYVEGQNIRFEYRRSGGRVERWPDLAAELVRLRVQVIVTSGTPAAMAAKRATTTIPIVMAVTGDPLSTGLVASLAQPGANVTGLSQLGAGLAAKRLELLREVVPNISRVAFLWNPANVDQHSHFNEAQAGARSLGLTLHSVGARSREELERAFTAMMHDRPSALLMTGDAVHQLHIDWIIAFAARHRLPVMYQLPEVVDRGGLIAYGAVRSDLVRRAAVYVDKILKGARPGDLPVEQPTKFELAINLKAAKAIGLTIPASLLLRADHVVE